MIIIYAFVIDLWFGDPRWLPHPVTAIAALAKFLEGASKQSQLAGSTVWLGVVAATCGVVCWTCALLPSPWIQVYWVYSFLAVRSLDDHAMSVIAALRSGDLAASRYAVSRIVGRDTANLDQRDIARATIETVAENLNDGVVAPLFWLAVAGPVGMAGYKAVNTLDSMFGYRNEKYRHFGWCSARMDDVASWVPARLTAALIWLVAALAPGMSAGDSIAVTLRDASRQPSPNSGYPEAAVAGALGFQLGGVSEYGGVRSRKEFLGDGLRPLGWQSYNQVRVILYAVSTLAVLIVAGVSQWR